MDTGRLHEAARRIASTLTADAKNGKLEKIDIDVVREYIKRDFTANLEPPLTNPREIDVLEHETLRKLLGKLV